MLTHICLHIYVFSYPGAREESKIRKKRQKMSFVEGGEKPLA